ncbi:MAG: hypothetical protein WDO73_33580 [Ignavibacteriota bacterium]
MAREAKKETPKVRKALWRAAAIAAALATCTGVCVYLVHRYLINDPKFVLSHDRREALTIDGLHYGSRSKVQHIFAQDADHSVFAVPLDERRRRLLAIDWVQDAAVSRVCRIAWPCAFRNASRLPSSRCSRPLC